MDKKIEHPKSKSLEELTLDSPLNKYQLVNAVMRWAQELKGKGLATGDPQQVLEQSLTEIITGQVSVEQIKKLPALMKQEEEKLEKGAKKEEAAKKESGKKAIPEKRHKK